MQKYILLGMFILFQVSICLAQGTKAPFLEDRIPIKGRTISLSKPLKLKPKKKLVPYFIFSTERYEDVLSATKDWNGVVLHEGLYKPTFIFRSGMNAYRYYKTYNDLEARNHFMNQVNWLTENFEELNNTYGFWFWRHPRDVYKLEANWTSALSQGMGIGLALMAYHETNDSKYLAIAEKAFKGYVIPVENQGFFKYWGVDIWFEEYPTEIPSRVMNGFIFSLAGIYNLYANTGNKLALWLFTEGVETLKKNIDLYDADFISNYSLFKKDTYWPGWAKKSYHKLHIIQLLWLYDITKEEVFYEKAKKFLEVQKTTFKERECNIERIIDLKANSQINEHSPSNIYDGQWSWGGIWAAKVTYPELMFELGKVREISGFSLFHNSAESSDIPIEVFLLTEDGERIKVKNLVKKDHFIHPSGKKRVTYIDVYDFEPAKGKEMYIQFQDPIGDQIVKITEVDVFIDLTEEIQCLFASVKSQRIDDKALFK